MLFFFLGMLGNNVVRRWRVRLEGSHWTRIFKEVWWEGWLCV